MVSLGGRREVELKGCRWSRYWPRSVGNGGIAGRNVLMKAGLSSSSDVLRGDLRAFRHQRSHSTYKVSYVQHSVRQGPLRYIRMPNWKESYRGAQGVRCVRCERVLSCPFGHGDVLTIGGHRVEVG